MVGEGDPGSGMAIPGPWIGVDREVDPGHPGMARIGVGEGGIGVGIPSLLMYTCELD